MEKGVANGLELSVDLPLLCESLCTLADDVEVIASGEADDRSDYDAWERRTSAGLQITRIRAMLNGGELDLAAVDLSTLRTLRNVWLTICDLNYGDHCDDPASYRGPVFLPHELGPDAVTGLRVHLRQADEAFSDWEDFPGYEQVDPEMFPVLKRTTTKRELWSHLPDELRRYATLLTAREHHNAPDAQAADLSPALPEINLNINQARYDGHCYDVTADGALLLSKLVENYPHPINASSLFTKPSRIKNGLPDSLKALIVTEPGKGYRLHLG